MMATKKQLPHINKKKPKALDRFEQMDCFLLDFEISLQEIKQVLIWE